MSGALIGSVVISLMSLKTASAVESRDCGSACAAAARPGLPRYYTLVTWATAKALRNYLRSGVPAVWEKAEGTR